MSQQKYEEAKSTLKEISILLKDESLTEAERQNLENIQASLSGALFSTWLPFGWGRRLIMTLLFLIGLFGVAYGNMYFLIAWLILLLFSPRCVGEFLHFLGASNSKLK